MSSQNRVLTIICAFIWLFSISGCASRNPMKSYFIPATQINPATTEAREIPFYKYGESIGKLYNFLGKVMAYKDGGFGVAGDLDNQDTPPQKMIEKLRTAAMGTGADAVIGIYYGGYRGWNDAGEYVSGLAVQILDGADGKEIPRIDLRLGILPVQTGNSDMSEKDYANLDRDLRVGARWFLEERGYYAPVDPAARFTGTIKELLAMSQSDLDDLYGNETELLLLLEVSSDKLNVPLIVEKRGLYLKATLLSKSLHKVLWKNHVAFEDTGLLYLKGLAKTKVQSTAIKEVLKPLPFFSRIGGKSEFVAYRPEKLKKKIAE